jgi:hypothetical protein
MCECEYVCIVDIGERDIKIERVWREAKLREVIIFKWSKKLKRQKTQQKEIIINKSTLIYSEKGGKC